MIPTLSIVTVCLNAAKTIEATLCSVAAQNYPNLEHIVVDGGSVDETLMLVRRFQPSVTQVLEGPDKGLYDALNKGILAAKGDVIGLLHADDRYAYSTVLQDVAQVFKDPQVQACYGDLVYVDEREGKKIVRYWRASPFQRGAFAKGWSPPHPTFFVRRSVYEQYGLFDITYKMGNDIELMMRFLEKHSIRSIYLPKVLVKMRLGGMSNRSLKNIMIQNYAILKASRQLNLAISPFSFFFYKLCNRLSQFILKPEQYNDTNK